MAEERLEFLIKAVDDASATLKKIEQGVTSLGGAAAESSDVAIGGFQGFALSLAGVESAINLAGRAISGLTSLVTSTITQFTSLAGAAAKLAQGWEEDERSAIALRTAMANQGGVSEDVASQIAGLADEIRKLTGADDAATRSSLTLLGSLVGFGAGLLDAKDAALDLAAATSSDLNQAFEALVRASQTGTLSLGRVRLATVDGETAAERYAAAVQFIAQQYGGTFQAQLARGLGGIDRLTGAWNEFQDAVGGAVFESAAFQDFIARARAIMENLVKVVDENRPALAAAFSKLFDASFRLAATSAGVLVAAVREVVEGLKEIVSIGQSLGLIADEWERIDDALDPVRDRVQAIAQQFELLGELSEGRNIRTALVEMSEAMLQFTQEGQASEEQVKKVEAAVQKLATALSLAKTKEEGGLIDPATIAQAEQSLAQVARRFRDIATLELGVGGGEEAQAEVLNIIAQVKKALAEPLSLSADAGADEFRRDLEGVESSAGAASLTLDQLSGNTREFGESARGAGGGAEELRARIDAIIQLGSKGLDFKVVDFQGDIEEILPVVAQFVDGINEVVAAVAESGDLQGAGFLGNVGSDIARQLAEMGTSTANLDSAAAQLEFFQEVLADFGPKGGQGVDQATAGLESMKDALSELQTQNAEDVLRVLESAESVDLSDASGKVRALADALKSIPADKQIDLKADVEVEAKVEGGVKELENAAQAVTDAAQGMERGGAAVTGAAAVQEEAADAANIAALELSNAAIQADQAGLQMGGAADDLRTGAQGLSSAVDSLESAVAAMGRTVFDMSQSAQALQNAARLLQGGGVLTVTSSQKAGNPVNFQVGGLVTSPVNAIIGESDPELVLPLNNRGLGFLRRLLNAPGGAATRPGTVNVTIQVDSLRVEDLDSIALEVENRLADRLLRTQLPRL